MTIRKEAKPKPEFSSVLRKNASRIRKRWLKGEYIFPLCSEATVLGSFNIVRNHRFQWSFQFIWRKADTPRYDHGTIKFSWKCYECWSARVRGSGKVAWKTTIVRQSFDLPFCQSYILLVDTRACLGQLVKLTPDFPVNLLSFKENTVKIRFKNIFKAILYIFFFFLYSCRSSTWNLFPFERTSSRCLSICQTSRSMFNLIQNSSYSSTSFFIGFYILSS